MRILDDSRNRLNLPPLADADLADAIYALQVSVGLEPAPAAGDRHGWHHLRRSQMVVAKYGGEREVLAWLT